MSFANFFASIVAPELRAVAAHWQAARGTRRMPAWSDIDPVAIGRNLRYVWSWKYDRVTDSFTGRLAGEEIDRAFGKSLRGMAMQAFFSPEAYSLVFPRHRRVAVEPALMHGSGLVFSHVHRTVTGERIIMPLAEDGVTGDGIFGATYYRPFESDSALAPGPDFAPERVEFFALEDPVVSGPGPATSSAA